MKLFKIPMVVMSFLGLGLLSGLDTPVAQADFTFGEPTKLGSTINTSEGDAMPCCSPDGLELYFNHGPTDALADIWVSRRATPDSPWGPPSNLGPMVNSPGGDAPGGMSADGLSLYLFSDRSGGLGGYDIWVTTRPTVHDDWDAPTNLGPVVNTAFRDQDPLISPDGLELYFTSDRPGGFGGRDLWVTKRATVSDAWGTPTNLGATVNSLADEWYSAISPDGLLLILTSNRPGGCGSGGALGLYDLYMTRRATKNDPWGAPVNLGPIVNGPSWDSCPNISADGSTLYFVRVSDPGVGADIWQAPILPLVDFNDDGIVDIDDLVILIENWGRASSQCDIGPMPWGDGKVDAQDLEVLMSYWGQEIPDPTLIAHWKLDEASGLAAADSVGTSDGVLVGDPVWQPTGGKRAGTLEFDGVDDYVQTPFVLDPADGPLRVFAWVKGGVPGQVIVSQVNGPNWLMAGASDGGLATELKSSGRTGKALKSATSITDGAWHRVGLVWDGSNRILYVDEVEVARDTQANLAASAGGLHIGAGSTLAPSTFWSGLIDEVRIYNRAVGP